MTFGAELPEFPRAAQTTLRCRTVASGLFRQANFVRDLPPLVVEERFGQIDGVAVPTPSETLLAALGSCLGVHLHATAIARNILVHEMEIEVEMDFASSPMWNAPGQPPRVVGFDAMRVAVRIRADASAEALESLVAEAMLWSPVASTSQAPVHIDVALARPA